MRSLSSQASTNLAVLTDVSSTRAVSYTHLLLYRTSDTVLSPGPFLTAKLVELWFSGILSGILLYHVKLGGKNIEIRATLIPVSYTHLDVYKRQI